MLDPVTFIRQNTNSKADLVSDSRAIKEGDVFFAIDGETTNGFEYVDQAIEYGAAAVLWEQHNNSWQSRWSVPNLAVPDLKTKLGAIGASYYAHPSRNLEIIAVTGTKGKTTVAMWVAQLLRVAEKQTGYIGTLGTDADDGSGMQAGKLTTPELLNLHKRLAVFMQAGCKAVVMEASAHGLAQNRLDNVECDIAVFTNLGSDHLDYFTSVDDYFAAKKSLFTRSKLNAVVVNGDDPNAQKILNDTNADKIITCGKEQSNALRWELVKQSQHGATIKLNYESHSIDFELPVPGEFNAANVALAAGVALASGLSFNQLEQGLTKLTAITGRLQRVGDGEVFGYVDYAHTPESLQVALETLRTTYPHSKLHCVFGCGGDRDTHKRSQMGSIAEQFADWVVVTNDNPRNEDPLLIADQIVAGMQSAPAAMDLDRSQAIRLAVKHAQAGDVVLVAGKGHEQGIEFANNELVPFDDATVLADELRIK